MRRWKRCSPTTISRYNLAMRISSKQKLFLGALLPLATVPCVNADGQYRSRPDLAPPHLNITVSSVEPNSTEYVFVAPYSGELERPGPYIYRKDGDLVWAGTGYYAGFVANFHVTKYQGKDVIQAFQGTIDSSHGEGFGQHVILNQNYEHVVTSTAENHRISSIHEFNVIDGKTALIEVFDTIPANLTAFGGNSSQKWLGNGIFQGRWTRMIIDLLWFIAPPQCLWITRTRNRHIHWEASVWMECFKSSRSRR